LVFHLSTIAMMHGPINSRFYEEYVFQGITTVLTYFMNLLRTRHFNSRPLETFLSINNIPLCYSSLRTDSYRHSVVITRLPVCWRNHLSPPRSGKRHIDRSE